MRIQFWYKAGFIVLVMSFSSYLHADDGQKLYEEKCAVCHILPDPHNLTAEMWPKQMELMAPLAGLKPEEKDKITRYLVSNGGQLDEILVEERRHYAENCSSCHQEKTLPATKMMGHELQEYLLEHVEDKAKKALPENIAHEIAEYFLHTKLQ